MTGTFNNVKARLVTVMIATLMLCSLIACGSTKTYSINGTWGSDGGKITEITFNEDGTGTLKKSAEISVNFTYTSQDDKVSVTTEVLGQKTETTYTYTVTEDKLTLTNGSDTTEFSKK